MARIRAGRAEVPVYPRFTMEATWRSISAALLACAVGVIGGVVYYEPRPFVVEHFRPLVPHAPDHGFPSDRALLVSAIAMIGTIWNRKLGVALWILAVLGAVGRV